MIEPEFCPICGARTHRQILIVRCTECLWDEFTEDIAEEFLAPPPPDPMEQWVRDEICRAMMIPEHILTGIRYIDPYPEESEG